MLAALAIICGLIAWDGLAEGWTAYRTGAAEVPVRLGAASAAAACLTLAALALLLMRSSSGHGAHVLFRIVLVAGTGLIALPVIAAVATAPVLGRMGYARCERANASERLTLRWCRPSPDRPRRQS